MINLGISDILDKTENHFDRRTAKFFLFLVIFTATTACLSITWSYVQPFVTWALAYDDPKPEDFLRLTSIMFNLFSLIFASYMTASLIDYRRMEREQAQLFKELGQVQDVLTEGIREYQNCVLQGEFEDSKKALDNIRNNPNIIAFIKQHESNETEA
ncbi:MAG: hypothetical protein KDK26_05485 [Roseivivax sp.]|nr:hypothetical protein [Roseivivax sp.]